MPPTKPIPIKKAVSKNALLSTDCSKAGTNEEAYFEMR
jgi:hypothetical protein